MNKYTGVFSTGDYKITFNDNIDTLFSVVKEVPIEETIENVRLMTDAYIEETGERPDAQALDRLSTLIQNDYYTDPHPDKMTREEYPSLTETQREEREKGEVSLVWAEEIGTDGKDYRPQTRDNMRKLRDATSGHLRDKDVYARNKARRKKYREFTKTQPVVTYYLPGYPRQNPAQS